MGAWVLRGGRGLGRGLGKQVRTTTPRRPRAASPRPRDPRDLGAVAAAILPSPVSNREWTDATPAAAQCAHHGGEF